MNSKDKVINNFKLHPIGIGTWMMGGGIYREIKQTFADYSKDSLEIDAIKYAISKGQNHIDTAFMYGAGHTEELVGKAIKEFNREELFIADKLWKSHAKRNAVIPAVNEMLRRLETSYIDLLYVHAPFTEEPMTEYINGVNDALDAGLIKSIAVSNFNLDQLKLAQDLSKHPIVANQLRYNILYKTDANQEMLNYCKKHNILVVAYRPVERKLLGDETINNLVLNIAKKYNKTPAQIALNWLIAQENVVVIPKSSNHKHIDDNFESIEFDLDLEDWNALNNIPSIE